MDDYIADLSQKIQAMHQTQGLDRENALLRVANALFEYAVADPEAWQKATEEERKAWRQEIGNLLDALEFSIASAEHVTGDNRDLSHRVGTLQDSMRALQEQVEAQAAQRDKLNTEQEELYQQAQAIQSQKEQLEQEVTKARQTYQTLKTEVDALRKQLQELENRSEQLQAEKTKAQEELTNAQTQVEKFQQEVASLKKQRDTLQDQVQGPDGLQGEAEQLERYVAVLQQMQEIIPFWQSIQKHIDEARLQLLAQNDFVQSGKHYKQSLQSMQEQVQQTLQRMNELLQEELKLTEEEWDTIRGYIDGS